MSLKRCLGNQVDFDSDATSSDSCLNLCDRTEDCAWFTYDEADGTCLLLEDCIDVDRCEGCVIGRAECATGLICILFALCTVYNNIDFQSVFLIIGGYNTVVLDDADVVQVTTSDDDLECAHLASLPYPGTFFVGLLDSENRPVVCGGGDDVPNPNACLYYDRDVGDWVSGPDNVIRARHHSATVRLSDGRFWIVGGEGR